MDLLLDDVILGVAVPLLFDTTEEKIYPVHNWGDNFDLFDKGGKA